MTPDQATFLLNVLLPQFKAEHKTTLKVLEAVPADKGDYRPDPRSMDALSLSWHIASADIFFLALASHGEMPAGFDGNRPESIQTPAGVAPWYAENFATYLDKVSALTGEQLLKKIQFHTFSDTALGYLQLMMVHTVHHRGQLSAYLRPMGAKVPSIYGGSADEPMTGAAAS